MANRFRVSSMLLRRLDEQGLAPAALMRHAGLPASLLEQNKIWVTTEELFALYKAMQELSTTPDLGLRLGSEQRIERYDPITIAALYTRSFGDALDRMARYKRLTCPEEIRVAEQDGECTVQFAWLLAEQCEPPMLIDICFAWVLSIARRGTGRAVQAKRVEFRRAEAHRELYEAHFGCPVTFGAANNTLVFDATELNAPFVTHNEDLLEIVAPQLEAELKQQLAHRSLKEQVKGILKKFLAGRKPRLEDVADEMRVSSRTLQRRLLEERATFQGVVEEARRELAQHYLMQEALELNQTAFLLGYEDPNSFFRAFHRWEGTTPGEWRAARCTAV